MLKIIKEDGRYTRPSSLRFHTGGLSTGRVKLPDEARTSPVRSPQWS